MKEQHQHAEMDRKQSIRQRTYLVGMTFMFLAMIAAAYFAFYEYGIANQQRTAAGEQEKTALSLDLAAQALSILPANPELSLSLIIEANKLNRSLMSEEALRTILGQTHLRAVIKPGCDYCGFNSAVFSTDGKWVVLQGGLAGVTVWDVSANKKVTDLNQPGLTFGTAGSLTVSLDQSNNSAKIWDTATRSTRTEIILGPSSLSERGIK